MKITFAPKGILQIDEARIVFRNFSGTPSRYNREGDRNFAVVIPTQEQADALLKDGWNVKIRPPRDGDDEPFRYLSVKIKFSNYGGPAAYLITGNRKNELTEDTITCLDNVDIESVDLDIRPHNWDRDGDTGRTAYLQAIRVFQKTNRFATDPEDIDGEDAPW